MTKKGKTVPQLSDEKWVTLRTNYEFDVKHQERDKLICDMVSNVNAFEAQLCLRAKY